MSSFRARASRPRSMTAAASAAAAVLLASRSCHGFTAAHGRQRVRPARPLGVFAPPGSGYVSHVYAEEEEEDDARPSLSTPELTAGELRAVSPRAFPSTYEPMLEYPGTMRPGRTPENMPYHDLPNLGIDDPDPVPWPHFQEIEWHHRWDPPHPQATTMEDFIEEQGRWASVEDEAEMRMGLRRGVRERREREELGGTGGTGSGPLVITDDEDEEGEEPGGAPGAELRLGLGEGVEALLRTAAGTEALDAGVEEEATEEEDEGDDDDDDAFLLDLGLGGDEAEEGEEVATKATVAADADADDAEDLDLAFELGFDLDDDDDDDDEDDKDEATGSAFDLLDGGDDDADMSLDDYNKKDDGGDEDALDDGGFDYGE